MHKSMLPTFIKSLLFLIFIFFTAQVFSQDYKLSGKYVDDKYYLKVFPDSTIEYYSNIRCGLGNLVKGYGKYTISDSIICVCTEDSLLTGNFAYEIIGRINNRNKMEFEIIDENGIISPFINEVAKGKKYLNGNSTDKEGKCKLTVDSTKCQLITISYVGRTYITIPFYKIAGCKIRITYPNYVINRNRYNYFRIRSINNETIICGPYNLDDLKNVKEEDKLEMEEKMGEHVLRCKRSVFRQVMK